MDSREQFEKAQLEQIYASAPVGLVLVDPELRFLRINDRLAAINGIPAADHIGKTVAEVVPDLAPQCKAMRDQFLAGSGPITKLFTGTTPAQPGAERHWIEHWSPIRAEDGTLLALNIAVEEVTEQRQQEERAALMMGELRHRLKNTLAVVQSIARNTFSPLEGSQGPIETFEARLNSLARAHDLMMANAWERAEVQALVKAAMGQVDSERLSLSGPVAFLTPDAAMTLALALHELCTNAVKYGALSAEDGGVAIRWDCNEDKVHLEWEETGGPAVTPPAQQGFGLRLLTRMLRPRGGADSGLEFRPEGLLARMTLNRDSAL